MSERSPLRILCYGDSNTWGYEAGTGLRYNAEVRWPGVLQRRLGAGYQVIEEGLNGRTTVWDDPLMPGRNGFQYLLPCVESHRPFELLVLMLGTNDLKVKFSASPLDIARGVAMLVKRVRTAALEWPSPPPRVMVLAPPPLGPMTEFAEQFAGATVKRARLGELLAATTAELGCAYLDVSGQMHADDRDGLHIGAEAHQLLGEAVADQIRSLDFAGDGSGLSATARETP